MRIGQNPKTGLMAVVAFGLTITLFVATLPFVFRTGLGLGTIVISLLILVLGSLLFVPAIRALVWIARLNPLLEEFSFSELSILPNTDFAFGLHGRIEREDRSTRKLVFEISPGEILRVYVSLESPYCLVCDGKECVSEAELGEIEESILARTADFKGMIFTRIRRRRSFLTFESLYSIIGDSNRLRQVVHDLLLTSVKLEARQSIRPLPTGFEATWTKHTFLIYCPNCNQYWEDRPRRRTGLSDPLECQRCGRGAKRLLVDDWDIGLKQRLSLGLSLALSVVVGYPLIGFLRTQPYLSDALLILSTVILMIFVLVVLWLLTYSFGRSIRNGQIRRKMEYSTFPPNESDGP